MADLELSYLTIADASSRIEAGELSPLALTEALFERIAESEGQLNAFVRLMRESAMEEAAAAAERAGAGRRRGPLDGIGVAVKDLYDTAGVVTAGGAAAYRERVPDRDATAVRLLREAGAVILGKTNTHEIAMGGTTNNPFTGATHNPWKLDHVPGGSSGGSGAALAAGQAPGALGTDTAGSIRVPAAFCGVSGHKPTYGLVGRGGVMPLSWTLDHAGPMARSARDCALMLTVLAGPDPDDFDSAMREGEDYAASIDEGVDGLTLAVIPSLCDAPDAVREHFERSLDVLRGLGARIDRCEPMAGFGNWRAPLSGILAAEAAAYHRDAVDAVAGGFSEGIRNRLRSSREIPAVDYIRGLQHRKLVEQRFEDAILQFDAFLVPTSPMTAEPIEGAQGAGRKFHNTGVFNNTRQPAITVPNGFDGSGLPTGLMIAAAQFDDAMALRIAHAYQQATDFHTRHPDLSGAHL